MTELGVGIVGYGFIGKVHTYAHRTLPLFYDPMPATTKLVGVCTEREASGQKAKVQAGFEFATTRLSGPAGTGRHPHYPLLHA